MLLEVVLIISLKQATTDVNLALNKKVTYCGTLVSSKIVDGNKSPQNAEPVKTPCTDHSYIDIELGNSFYVHYVVVYEGEPVIAGALDFFSVENTNSKGVSYSCSMYTDISLGPKNDQGMRVNCLVELCTSVRIKSHRNIGFSIAEIEVYTLASGNPEEAVMIHHGCSESMESYEKFTVTSIKECLNRCGQSYAFAGMKNGNQCHCGRFSTEAQLVPLERCELKCDGLYCGGKDTFSVYIVSLQLPYNNGCRKEISGLDGFTIDGNMTVHKCLVICKKFIVALIKNGNECYCINSVIEPYFEEYALCNAPCTGDPKRYCGGKKYATVFINGAFYKGGTWLDRLQCEHWNEFGVCSNKCEPGFAGDFCLELLKYITKDTQMERSYSTSANVKVRCVPEDLCKNETNTECIVAKNAYRCICLPGFEKDNPKKPCEDSDECAFEPCDLRKSFCQNQPGSYNCRCKDGYRSKSHDICELDVNKSMLDPDTGDDIENIMFVVIPVVGALFISIFTCFVAPPKTDDDKDEKRSATSNDLSSIDDERR